MSFRVYRPYPFREKPDPAIRRALTSLGVRFETRLHEGTAAAVMLLKERIDDRFLDRGPNLRAICVVAVGVDSVDVPAMTRRGVMLTNTPDVLTGATADIAFALLLAAARRVTEGDRYVRAGKFRKWDFYMMRGAEVHGKTLGIVGAGRIGQAVARRGRGFEMDILYASPSRERAFERETRARRVSLRTLLRTSDFVSIHVPLSKSTRRLIGRKELALMKRSAVLVNTARGAIVDEAALVKALKARRIAAAGLDVYEKEPAVHPGLVKLENVALCPHIGSSTDETRLAMYETALRNLIAVLRRKVPPNCVNARELGIRR